MILAELKEFAPLLDMREEVMLNFLEQSNAFVEDKEKMVAALKCLHTWTGQYWSPLIAPRRFERWIY